MSSEYDALVDEWGEATVAAAFVLQRHIKEHGLDGINYMKKAREHAETTGESTTKESIESALNQRY
jgi:hypothetical protein